MSRDAKLKEAHKNGSVNGFTEALFCSASAMLREHGKRTTAATLVGLAMDLGLVPELREQLAALKGKG